MLMEIQGRLCLILTVIIICCGLTCGQNSWPNIIFVLADDLVSMLSNCVFLSTSIYSLTKTTSGGSVNGD